VAVGRLARYGLTIPCPADLRLWEEGAQRPVDEEAALVLEQIGRAADPNLALRQLHRVFERDPAVLEAVCSDENLRIRLITVLGASSALGDQLAAAKDAWRVIRHAFPPRYEVHPGLSTVDRLRKGYQSALVRIAAADLSGEIAGIETVMTEITALADATLRAAYRIALEEVGGHPRLAVIAMGKCGGGELNYVSDVDVIFVAAEDEDLAAGTRIASRRCGPKAAADRSCARSPAIRSTTSAGRGPGSSRRCSKRGRSPVTPGSARRGWPGWGR
jgi:glutamate-ammonia-ligase adenylyltransferase